MECFEVDYPVFRGLYIGPGGHRLCSEAYGDVFEFAVRLEDGGGRFVLSVRTNWRLGLEWRVMEDLRASVDRFNKYLDETLCEMDMAGIANRMRMIGQTSEILHGYQIPNQGGFDLVKYVQDHILENHRTLRGLIKSLEAPPSRSDQPSFLVEINGTPCPNCNKALELAVKCL